MPNTSELDLIVKYASKKAGGSDGQLVLDDVELNQSQDNRPRHGIGNQDPQYIEKGNREYSFSTTAMLNGAAATALKEIANGNKTSNTVYIKDDSVLTGKASDGLIPNDVTFSSSDGGDTTVSIDADLLGVTWTDNTGTEE